MVVQIVGEERGFVTGTEFVGGGFAEGDFAEVVRAAAPLAVIPRTDYEEIFFGIVVRF